uniref:ZnMc domain-containing protein n=1 Tax=Angiostrongylus cantonensis TaxID=6313 RepID=A0A0K0DN43_ANGCA
MRVTHFVLLTIGVSSEIINGDAGSAIPSARGMSFEEKLEESYQLLKNEKYANETKNFLEELHNLEENKLGGVPEKPDDNDNFLNEKDNNATMTIEEVNRRNKVDTALFQGDMFLTKEQAEEIIDDIKHNQDSRNKRQAYRGETYPNNIWPNNLVYYSFFPNATDNARRVFRKATVAWNEVTCLDFKEDENAKDRIGVYTSNGCFSRVGKVGGVQGLSIGGGCETIAAIKSIGKSVKMVDFLIPETVTNASVLADMVENIAMRG